MRVMKFSKPQTRRAFGIIGKMFVGIFKQSQFIKNNLHTFWDSVCGDKSEVLKI